jgi:hypothetical protein
MYHFRSNPPCRQVKPAPAFVPTFYSLPSVGDAIPPAKLSTGAGENAPASCPPIAREAKNVMTNAQLLDGLARYLSNRPALTEAMLGRLFAKDDDLLSDMRRGRVLPNRIMERMTAFVAREVSDA